MVFHLATQRGSSAITKHLWYRRSLNRRVISIPYETLLDHREWRPGVYLFTDAERMTRAQKGYASWLYERLIKNPDRYRVLNHPTRHVSRFDLLRTLYEQGRNAFNVFRLDELDGTERYPLFLRYENQHIGSSTSLLRSRADVDREILSLAASGEDLSHIIAVEFVDTSDSQGHFRKYGAFRVGEHIVPRHMFLSPHWEVKIDTNTLSAFRRREEYAYLNSNPHAEQVMEVFKIAGLDYGRIDYAVKDGRLQVWEINDNPQVSSSLARYWRGRLGRCRHCLKGLDAAFAQLESGLGSSATERIEIKEANVWEALCNQS